METKVPHPDGTKVKRQLSIVRDKLNTVHANDATKLTVAVEVLQGQVHGLEDELPKVKRGPGKLLTNVNGLSMDSLEHATDFYSSMAENANHCVADSEGQVKMAQGKLKSAHAKVESAQAELEDAAECHEIATKSHEWNLLAAAEANARQGLFEIRGTPEEDAKKVVHDAAKAALRAFKAARGL